MSEKLFVELHCKPYVKRFIDQNFGSPADFSLNKELHDYFLRALKKPNKRWDCKKDYQAAVSNYKAKTDLIISEDIFYRYGWMLSITDTVAINRIIEGKVKCFMNQMVGVSVANGKPMKDSIEDFQHRFDYPEDVWPYESIKKNFQRSGNEIARNYQNEIIKINQQLFMVQLSRVGTLAQKGVKYYEKHQQTT